MPPLGHHIRIQLADNRAILQSDVQRRTLSRVVFQQGLKDGLLGFSLPDTHLHLEALCDLRTATRLSQRITTSLKQRLKLPVSFVTYPHEPIRDQSHLYNTLRYILTQHKRHGLDLRTFVEATNLPDLLGLRLIGRFTRDNVLRCLPRVHAPTMLEWVGLPAIRPADGPLRVLHEATLSAAALNSLVGKSPPAMEARRAMLEVVGDRLGGADAARLLGVSERAVYALKHRFPDPGLVQAIRLQLGLRRVWQMHESSNLELCSAG